MLIGIWTVLIFFAGLKWRQALLLGALALLLGLFAWFVLFDTYQHERILTFMDPSRDPLGRGYNVTQAIIAVGSGEWFGRGLGFGSQSQLKFLPESQTDFIFAVIAEELGFVGVLFILGAFTLLFTRLFRLIRLSREDYTTYLLLGVIAIIFLQILVNIGMNLGLLPVTGIGLPLVSYGGSSIIMSLALIGIAESVAIRTSSS
jgi:rod shape determining protein RodA